MFSTLVNKGKQKYKVKHKSKRIYDENEFNRRSLQSNDRLVLLLIVYNVYNYSIHQGLTPGPHSQTVVNHMKRKKYGMIQFNY